jgi:hypothetical protein
VNGSGSDANLGAHTSEAVMHKPTLSKLPFLMPLVAVALLCLVPASCGSDDDETFMPKAQAKFDAGDLEAAERFASLSTSAEADELRAKIVQARKARTDLDAEIAKVMSAANTGSVEQARSTLTSMRDTVKDPVSREHVNKALEQLRSIEAARAPVEPKVDPDANKEKVSPEVAAIRSAALARDWIGGLELVRQATEKQTIPAADLAAARKLLIDGGQREITTLVSSVIKVEREKGSKAAYDMVKEKAARFPDIPEFDSIPGLLHDLGIRAGINK